jgi:hypothetical protein
MALIGDFVSKSVKHTLFSAACKPTGCTAMQALFESMVEIAP